MKKILVKGIISFFVTLLIICQFTYADEYALFGGIKRDEFGSKEGTFVYEEMCFLTGEPVLLRGTVVIPEISESDSYSTTIKYTMQSSDKKIKIDRSVTYNVDSKKNAELNQKITNWTINSGGIKESIYIDGQEFKLTSYDFDNSIISDLKPAGDFKTGSLHFKKVFNTNEPELDEGKRITIIGDSMTYASYKNIWSKVSTMVVNQKINVENLPSFKLKKEIGPFDGKQAESSNDSWQATVKYRFSEKSQSKFDYVNNSVKNTSFRKGLLKSNNNEYNVDYEYNLPDKDSSNTDEESGANADKSDSNVNDGKLNNKDDEKKLSSQANSARKYGKIKLESYLYDNSTMLPIPKYNDVGGHWAEEDIFKMASLGGFDLDSSFFPDVYITRAEFSRAILNAIDSVEVESKDKRITEYIKSKRTKANAPLFEDVDRNDKYYIFIEGVNQREMMLGEGNNQFLPNRPLTRQEAITIIIRSLGLNDIAPSLPFTSNFIDDASISAWARPSIYQAVDLNIVSGYLDGSIQPRKLMTRAETSHILVHFIEHLRNEMPKDYRDLLKEEF